jgi:fatty-acyl-CoA synthase
LRAQPRFLHATGENVAAAEVEGHLIGHPAVLLGQVVAAPDARYTEVPAAFIQLAAGESVTGAELRDYCLGAIATFKVPRYFRFVDDWPMSGTKIKKHVLRDQIAAESSAAGITEAPNSVLGTDKESHQGESPLRCLGTVEEVAVPTG